MRREDELDAEIEREHRVWMTGHVALALIDGTRPDPEAASFVGAALLARVTTDINLEREALRITAPRGSHRRPEVIGREYFSSSSAMKRDTRCTVRDPQSSKEDEDK